jgi:hypothetical protein
MAEAPVLDRPNIFTRMTAPAGSATHFNHPLRQWFLTSEPALDPLATAAHFLTALLHRTFAV